MRLAMECIRPCPWPAAEEEAVFTRENRGDPLTAQQEEEEAVFTRDQEAFRERTRQDISNVSCSSSNSRS